MDKEKLKKGLGDFVHKVSDVSKDAAVKVKDATIVVKEKTVDTAAITKEKLIEALDENKDGEVSIEDIIIKGLRTPGVRIDREEFLRKELFKNYSEDIINDVVLHNPSHAGITIKEIDKIADEVIKYERNCVSGISAALGAPGGAAMIATLPADIIQYYGYMLRTIQKLMYLYGFPEIKIDEKNNCFDSETINLMVICFGVMYGVASANSAIKAVAAGLAKGISKKIMTTALTKGTIYPIIKNVAKWFGVKMTKKLLAGFVQKSIPLVGAVIGGGLTFFSFKPCCDNLKESLRNTMLSNPDYKAVGEEKELIEDLIKEAEYIEKEK